MQCKSPDIWHLHQPRLGDDATGEFIQTTEAELLHFAISASNAKLIEITIDGIRDALICIFLWRANVKHHLARRRGKRLIRNGEMGILYTYSVQDKIKGMGY